MSGKILCHLLLFCGILCQEIFATLSDDDTRISSDSLVRKRRVVNLLPNGGFAVPIESVPYVVRIKDSRRMTCAGVILSHYSVITAAPCFRDRVTTYHIYSGASGNVEANLQEHNITSKVEYFGNKPIQPYDGIALVTVDPPFQFNRKTGYIELYVGPLNVGLRGTVFGWGYGNSAQSRTNNRHRLRHIVLPIMSLQECQHEYLYQFPITPKNICTYCEHQYCAESDKGAPLVVRNKLAGIFVWKGEFRNQKNPDIYINLQRPEYKKWIIDNTLLM